MKKDDLVFDPNKKAEKDFFAKFMQGVTPPSEIVTYATNGAALVFRPVDANEFSKIERASKQFIEAAQSGRRTEWAEYRIADAGLLFKLFFLSETMIGWHEESEVVNAKGDPCPEDEEGARLRPKGPRLPKWDQKSWLWFASKAVVSYRAVETQALQGQAIGTAGQELKAVNEMGEDSSATS